MAVATGSSERITDVQVIGGIPINLISRDVQELMEGIR